MGARRTILTVEGLHQRVLPSVSPAPGILGQLAHPGSAQSLLAPAGVGPLTISTRASGIFGTSVAISGDEVAVSGYDAVYLYNTAGHLLQTFHNPNPNLPSGLGAPVALGGNEMLIGASGQGDGYAYLFSTSGQLLHTFSDPAQRQFDDFGSALAMSGNEVLIGARNSSGGPDTAYLFDAAGNLLHVFDAQDQAGFANAWLAISGNQLLIGSVAANGQTGVARLYSTDGTLLQTFTDPQAAGRMPDCFGDAVSLSDGNVLIGAEDTGNTVGVVYLYDTSGNLLHTFQDPGRGNGDFFGSSVVLSGNYVLIAARDAYANPGVAYLFNTSGQLLRTFADPNPVKNDGFASTVDLNGGHLVIGSYGTGYVGGNAYVYPLPPATTTPVVVTNPVSQTVDAYQTVTFTTAATGRPTPTVQWQISTDGGKTFTNAVGETSNTLTLAVYPGESGWRLRAVFTNAAGSAVTKPATLTVVTPAWMKPMTPQLVFLYHAYEAYLVGPKTAPFQPPSPSLLEVKNGLADVALVVSSPANTASVVHAVTSLGAQVEASVGQEIDAWVPITHLPAIGALAHIAFVTPVIAPILGGL